MAVHIALHEIGSPFEMKSLSFHKKEHRQPPFLALNPAGKVPTLVIDGGFTMIESAAMCMLIPFFPEARLLPGDTLIIVSDGMLDAFADPGEAVRAAEDLVASGSSADEIADRILAAAAYAPLADDLTAVVVRREAS